MGIRLPAAGATSRYYFGDDPSVIGRYAWFKDNSGGTTHPVCLLRPNDSGLYDMLGNVWEWCGDTYVTYENRKDKLNIGSHTSSIIRKDMFSEARPIPMRLATCVTSSGHPTRRLIALPT